MAKDFSDMTKEEMEDLIGDGSFSLKERVRVSILTKQDKGWPTYDEKTLDRTEYITASEASKCARMLAFEKIAGKLRVAVEDFWDKMPDEEFKAHLLGMGNDDMRGIFERGNAMEDWLVSHLERMEQPGEHFLLLGDDQRSFYTDKRKVSGTPDGLYVNLNEGFYRVLEFKSSQNPITEPRDYHVRQLSVNFGLIEMLAKEGLLDEWMGAPLSQMECKGGNLLYVETDNWLKLTEFKIQNDKGVAYEEACMKARKVFVKDKSGAIVVRQPDTVEPEGLKTWNGCYFCNHKTACRQIEQGKAHTEASERLSNIIKREAGKVAVVPKMPDFKAGVTKKQLAEMLLQYDEARASEKAHEKVKEAIKKHVKEWINKQEGRTADFVEDGVTFTISLSTSTRAGAYDMKALGAKMEELGVSIVQFQKEPTEVQTLNVKVKPVTDAEA